MLLGRGRGRLQGSEGAGLAAAWRPGRYAAGGGGSGDREKGQGPLRRGKGDGKQSVQVSCRSGGGRRQQQLNALACLVGPRLVYASVCLCLC